MSTYELLVSSGAIVSRFCGRDFGKFACLAHEIEADGFEFMMLPSYYGKFDEILKQTEENGIAFKTFHIEKDIGYYLALGGAKERLTAMKLLEDNLKLAKALGVSLCVFHLWGGEVSDSHFDSCLSALPEIFSKTMRYSFDFTVENVPCTTQTPYRRLLQIKERFPLVHVTLDTRFAAYHQEEKLFLCDDAMLRDNIRHIHFSDLSAESRDKGVLRPILHPYEGCADFDLVFDFLRRTDIYCGKITVESPVYLPDAKFDIPKLNRTLDEIRKKLLK